MICMGLRGTILSWIRRVPIGIIPILVIAATALTGVLTSGNRYSNYVTIIVLGVCSVSGFYAYHLADRIRILCIQVDPDTDTPAYDHHHNEFDLEEGYSEFDVFVTIPEWKDEFILEFDADSPLEIGLWEVPDDYTEDGDTIECSSNAHDFGFVLIVGEDAEKLGRGSRDLRIYEKKSNEKLTTLKLKSEGTRKEASYRDRYIDGEELNP